MKYCASCKTVYPADFQCCPKDGSALSSSSELLPGMVIRDKYQILQQIGSGGMATVYQVRHLAFNEILAIKLINSQLADGDQFNKRLRAEAVIARKLQHPNAVHVQDLDRTEDGRPFIVMEYVEGQNLRTVIRREGPLPTLRALRIAAQVVSALAAAHKLGIIHRDIKPDNIHLIRQPDGSDFVKVLDFGIAKFTQGLSSSAPRTGSGLVVGTPQYVSPEQAMGRQAGELDGRSDLYTLGIVLYEMLTGRVPFDSDTPVGLLVHHLHTTPVPPDELRPDLGIPSSVSGVLMKALEKNPEHRFRNADEMLNAITTLEEQIQRVQETGTAETEASLINAPEQTQDFANAQEMLSAITPVEQPVPRVQGSGTGSMKAPEDSLPQPFSYTDGMLGAIPPAAEQVQPVEQIGTALMKTPEQTPEPGFTNADEMLNTNTAPEGIRDTTKPTTEPISSAFDVARVESPGFRDTTVNWAAPTDPPRQPMWPREVPGLRDARETPLPAAYISPASRRILYIGVAVFAVVWLAVLGIYQWRNASANPAGQSEPGLHNQSLPGAGTSTQPATQATGGPQGPATQGSTAATHPISASDAGLRPSSSPTILGEPEKLAKIKDLVSQGRALSDSGEYTAAIEMFDSALKLDPQSSEAKAGKRRAKERMQLEQALPTESK